MKVWLSYFGAFTVGDQILLLFGAALLRMADSLCFSRCSNYLIHCECAIFCFCNLQYIRLKESCGRRSFLLIWSNSLILHEKWCFRFLKLVLCYQHGILDEAGLRVEPTGAGLTQNVLANEHRLWWKLLLRCECLGCVYHIIWNKTVNCK